MQHCVENHSSESLYCSVCKKKKGFCFKSIRALYQSQLLLHNRFISFRALKKCVPAHALKNYAQSRSPEFASYGLSNAALTGWSEMNSTSCRSVLVNTSGRVFLFFWIFHVLSGRRGGGRGLLPASLRNIITGAAITYFAYTHVTCSMGGQSHMHGQRNQAIFAQ